MLMNLQTHRLCQKCIHWDLGFDRKKEENSFHLSDSVVPIFLRGFGMGEQKRDHWIIPEIFCFFKRRWLENLNLCFRTIYSSILVVSPWTRLQNCGLAENLSLVSLGSFYFQHELHGGTKPCILPVAIRHVKYLWALYFRLSPWTEGGFFIATGEIPPLRLYEW